MASVVVPVDANPADTAAPPFSAGRKLAEPAAAPKTLGGRRGLKQLGLGRSAAAPLARSNGIADQIFRQDLSSFLLGATSGVTSSAALQAATAAGTIYLLFDL